MIKFQEIMPVFFAGGDQLTAARVRGSQRVRSNGQRGLHRLEGIAPVVEDWHAKGCLLSVSSLQIVILVMSPILLYTNNAYYQPMYVHMHNS